MDILNFKIIPPTEAEYQKAKTKFISEYTVYIPGYSAGFLSGWVDARHDPRPDVGEVKWNEEYPDGYSDWMSETCITLTGIGEMRLIDKINELVEAVTKLQGAK